MRQSARPKASSAASWRPQSSICEGSRWLHGANYIADLTLPIASPSLWHINPKRAHHLHSLTISLTTIVLLIQSLITLHLLTLKPEQTNFAVSTPLQHNPPSYLAVRMDQRVSSKQSSPAASSSSVSSSSSQTSWSALQRSDSYTHVFPARPKAPALGFADGDIIRHSTSGTPVSRNRRGSDSSSYPIQNSDMFFRGLEWLLEASKPSKSETKAGRTSA